MPEFYDIQTPIARKQHKCCECGQTIHIGEKYTIIQGMWNGKFMKFKQCFTCAELYQEHFYDSYDGIAFGELWEYLREYSICELIMEQQEDVKSNHRAHMEARGM